MNKPDKTGLPPSVAEKISPMLQDMLAGHGQNVHSFHVVGSAVIPDYNEKLSDINSVVVLHSMDLEFIEFLAPLGGKYGKKRIAAPLVMTPKYIQESLDSFPIEFLDFKLLHATLYGDDLLARVEPDRTHLRIQCEREIKTKQIGLRQGYISSLGKKEQLAGALVRSFTGSMPLFRAVILLLGKEPPVSRAEVISLFTTCCGIDASILQDLLALKNARLKPSEQDLRIMFERYYRSLETIGKTVDELR
jgi:hypothetical protein